MAAREAEGIRRFEELLATPDGAAIKLYPPLSEFIPPREFRMRARRLKPGSLDERGNLIAHVNVLIPTKLNETERGLIEQFAASHDSGATHVSQASRPQAGQKKGFFSKLKDALS